MSSVYLKYFGLSEPPFAITPDPAFVYLSPAHRDALAHLLHGVGKGSSGGFVQLTGEVGTGKTTLCRCLLEQLPEKTQVALIFNPLVTPGEMLATICEELGIDTSGIGDSNKRLVDALSKYLLDKHSEGWQVVVVIDEAQNLSPETLEQVRLLTNLETAKHKLLQMVLLGQPELRQLLNRTDLRQLAQRITARYHLAPLDRNETASYVRHRMQVAGANRSPFTRGAINALHQRSGGVPRIINIIADRALAGAYATEASSVSQRMIHAAADEVQSSERQVQRNRMGWLVAAASSAVLLVVTIALMSGSPVAESTPVPESAVVQSAPAEVEVPEPEEVQALPPAVGNSSAAMYEPATLETGWLGEQHALAWQGVASLWSDASRAEAVRAACLDGDRSGFACVRMSGNWSRIQRLGLPALLVIDLDYPHYLLLNEIGESHVSVGVGAHARVLPKPLVEERWMGNFMVAWPQASGWPSQVQLGESGEAGRIVTDMARAADAPWSGGASFDADFENWLKAFQRRNGLDADGIVGPVTLLYLMAPTIETPRLNQLQAGNQKDS